MPQVLNVRVVVAYAKNMMDFAVIGGRRDPEPEDLYVALRDEIPIDTMEDREIFEAKIRHPAARTAWLHQICEYYFAQLNTTDHQERSMSVGDVIYITLGETRWAMVCRPGGWQEIQVALPSEAA